MRFLFKKLWVPTLMVLTLALGAMGCGTVSLGNCRTEWTCTSLNIIGCEIVLFASCDPDNSTFEIDTGRCVLNGCGGDDGCIPNPC